MTPFPSEDARPKHTRPGVMLVSAGLTHNWPHFKRQYVLSKWNPVEWFIVRNALFFLFSYCFYISAHAWNDQCFIVHVTFSHSLKANFSPTPPPLLPPLGRCLVRSTIVYSVVSSASRDTPKAKAMVQGEIVGWWPTERDTGSILVWELGSCLNWSEEEVLHVWL